MKYSKTFERDYEWFLKWKEVFNFDGSNDTSDKVLFSENGSDAKKCFYVYDSTGKILPTREPDLLFALFKCKGSINFNIKMLAESRGKGELGRIEFSQISKEFELLDWMINAVENQKFKFYEGI